MYIQRIVFAAYFILVISAQIQIQEASESLESLSTYSTYSTFSTFVSNSSFNAIPTLATSVAFFSNSTVAFSSISTIPNNTTSYATITIFQPSSHTHFSKSISRNFTNSSTSTKATQTAPYPDDSIGKYGRLHISSASRNLSGPFFSSCFASLVFYLL
ncbi:hypothetical protein BD560DRAFT_113596 [Blakeslea trispora]|nr:hypothetical protein BD560DRAFT_113596 [Blakeslea trispora]